MKGRLVVAACALLLGGAPRAERVLVDGVAAVVGRRVITLTEVETEGRMVLVNRAGAKGLEQPIDDTFRRSVLDYLLVQELLVQEARRVHGLAISEAEVDKGVAAFKARFDDARQFHAFLEETGADEEAVRTIVRRDLTVRALLRRVLEPAPAITDEDARRFLAENPGLLPDASEEIRLQAAREAVSSREREARFASYVDGLKQATEVRIVAGYARGAGAATVEKVP